MIFKYRFVKYLYLYVGSLLVDLIVKFWKCYFITESPPTKNSVSCTGESPRGSPCSSPADWGSSVNPHNSPCYPHSPCTPTNTGGRGEGRGTSTCAYGDSDHTNGPVYTDNRLKLGSGKFTNFTSNLRCAKFFIVPFETFQRLFTQSYMYMVLALSCTILMLISSMNQKCWFLYR